MPLSFLLGLPKWAYWLAGGVALVAAFLIWLHFHDRGVVEADRSAAEAHAAKTALDAERTANASDAPRQAEIQANDATTRKAIDDAAAKDPAKGLAPAGPVSNAASRALRERQARKHSPAS